MTATGTLNHHIETGREKVAFTKDKEIWTYERLASEVEHLARGLVERGLRKGDRIALHMANLPELIIAYHACLRVGALAAPLNMSGSTFHSLMKVRRRAVSGTIHATGAHLDRCGRTGGSD